MQPSLNTYKYITTGATTTFASTETKRVVLGAINVNKILTGTLVIKSGSTTIGTIAAAAPIGEYWYSNGGTEIEDLQITNASTEDVTVFYRNI
jgi:hypothetical protein